MNALLLWLLPGLPLGAGGLLLLVRRWARPVAISVAALTLGLAVHAAVTRPAVAVRLLLGEGAAVDGLSAVMVVTVAAAGLAVLVFAAGEPLGARFHGLMLIFLGAMLVTVTAGDLVLLLMGWEVMGAMSYALIGYRWRDPGRVRSGAVAFLTTRAGDLGLYFAAGAALAGGGDLALGGLPGLPPGWRDLVAGGIVLAALGKSAQLPFSYWLSRAMDGPSPVSALLHSATMVAAGAYLLLRAQPLLAATGWAAALVTWTGAVTALLLGAVAVAQRELKQLLAASTCAQVGYMVCAAGAGAVAGGVAHLVAHAAVKSLLFLGAGVWLSVLGTQELRGLGGAGRRYPVVGVAFGVGAVALAGVPPLSLWVTKDMILEAVRGTGPAAVLLVAGLLAAAYSGRALAAVWRGGEPGPGAREVTLWERVPLPVLALVAAGFGVVGTPGVFEAWRLLVGDPYAAAPAGVVPVLSGGLAVAVLAATVVVLTRSPAGELRAGARGAGELFAGWLGLERAVVACVVRPVMALARALARFDDRVLDAGVHATARAAGSLARALGEPGTRARAGAGGVRGVRTSFEARLDGLVRAVARAAGRLGTLARRPQTGQVHLYFAQATVALTALTVLAVVIALLR